MSVSRVKRCFPIQLVLCNPTEKREGSSLVQSNPYKAALQVHQTGVLWGRSWEQRKIEKLQNNMPKQQLEIRSREKMSENRMGAKKDPERRPKEGRAVCLGS